MNRRDLLRGIVALSATAALGGCDNQTGAGSMTSPYKIEISFDSDPDNFPESHVTPAASAYLQEHPEYKGLFSMPGPLIAHLPSGLIVSVTCERIASGHFHCGISHDGELVSMGKYKGIFAVRAFPPNHQSYMLEVTENGASVVGA